ncbi:MAG: AAA family ATPase, partial [candidate division Zixibacteria bacterium]|nr:AAA family ATPase [candidate division Zixibacteria bacterium]
MKLISSLKIEGFRSIYDSGSALNTLDNFCSFAGLNNSGKSNVLRALNAFFTDFTDPGIEINFTNDYNRHLLHSKKKNKCISISVHFSLPDFFRFRKGLEAVRRLLGREFIITKRWVRASRIPIYY